MRLSYGDKIIRAPLIGVLIALAILSDTATPFLARVAKAAAPDQTATAPSDSSPLVPFHPKRGHAHPLIAIIAENAGTETTDFIIPYGVLTQSGVAEVIAVGTRSGPIQMMPALKIAPQMTVTEFDARFPEGADYLFVPAVHNPDDKALLDFVRSQAHRGAIVIGICDGAWVVANAGLLDGRTATGHWYSLDSLQRKFATTTWVRNRRYVADGTVVTTTGVTASIPVSLALVESIAGRDKAMKVAGQLGVSDWSSVHDSNEFKLDWNFRLIAARNELSFWSHEKIGIAVSPGIDEIALALVADPYSRTFRSQALTVSKSNAPIRTRRGLTIIPDVVAGTEKAPARTLPSFESLPPVPALDWALAGIADAYGQPTAAFVAKQMEYKTSESGVSQARETHD